MYKRAEYQIIKSRLEEPRKFIQVVMGARQIGKSTVVKQVLSNAEKRSCGLEKFRELFTPHAAFIVGDGGISVEDFLSLDIRKLF